MVEYIKIDPKKLNKKDRELLMRLSFDRSVINTNNKLINTSIFIAISSFLISVFAIVKSTNSLIMTISSGITFVVMFVIYLVKFVQAQRKVEEQEKYFSNNFKTLFEDHFRYAYQNP